MSSLNCDKTKSKLRATAINRAIGCFQKRQWALEERARQLTGKARDKVLERAQIYAQLASDYTMEYQLGVCSD